MWFKKTKSSLPPLNDPKFIISKRTPRTNEEGTIWIKHPKQNKTLLVSAHRGYREEYPENTILAFNKAIEKGAKGIELDIRKTSDNEYIVMHDGTVDRTTNGTGSVSSLTLSQIKELDASYTDKFGDEFEGREDCKVPTLQEVIDEIKDKPIYISWHIKLQTSDIENVIQKLKEENVLNQSIIFISLTRINILIEDYPEVVFMNDGTGHIALEEVELAIEDGRNIVSTGINKWNKSAVSLAKEKNIITQGSYISSNYETNTQDLIDKEVNIILTDNPEISFNVFQENNLTQTFPIPNSTIKTRYNNKWEVIK